MEWLLDSLVQVVSLLLVIDSHVFSYLYRLMSFRLSLLSLTYSYVLRRLGFDTISTSSMEVQAITHRLWSGWKVHDIIHG